MLSWEIRRTFLGLWLVRSTNIFRIISWYCRSSGVPHWSLSSDVTYSFSGHCSHVRHGSLMAGRLTFGRTRKFDSQEHKFRGRSNCGRSTCGRSRSAGGWCSKGRTSRKGLIDSVDCAWTIGHYGAVYIHSFQLVTRV